MVSIFKKIACVAMAWAAVGAVASARDIINPIGEENLGELLIKEPQWGSLQDGNVFPYTIQYRNSALKAGDVVRVVEGTGCISLRSGYANQDFCGVVIKKKERTTFTLSALFLRWDARVKAEALAIDFGPVPKLVSSLNYSSFETTGEGKRGFVVLPHTFTHDYGLPDAPALTQVVSQGQILRLDLTPPDRRGWLIVDQPQREFVDPAAKYKNGEKRHFLIWRTGEAVNGFAEPSNYQVQNYLKGTDAPHGVQQYLAYQPQTRDNRFALLPLGKLGQNSHYEYVVNNLLVKFSIEARQEAHVVVKRVDVNDVLIKEENGQKYYAKGNYRVWRKNPVTGNYDEMQYVYQNGLEKREFPTKTGVDLLPGVYKVVVRFATQEGTDSREYDIDLSK